MPRGLRKRGRRHKNKDSEESPQEPEHSNYDGTELEGGEGGDHHHHELNQEEEDQENRPEPSWIIPPVAGAHRHNKSALIDPEAPFGFVDAEVKAYFRTVDVQIKNWQENQTLPKADGEEENETVGADPNEERRLFFVAALSEMRGKERQLATDPDCSLILERMAHSMDDFVRRVFMDSMAGSYEVLVKHRFGSHVCQTLVALAEDTIQREVKGVCPHVPDPEDKGKLRTMTQLILDICEEILPTFSSLIMDPFASHVIRSLLAVLSPRLAKEEDHTSSLLRSKKSATWKAKQGVMKSVFSEKGKGREGVSRSFQAPPEFQNMARRLIQTLLSELGENETRAMAANKVASPCLQMLLEVEADQGLSNQPGSLMDRATVGIITTCSKGEIPAEPSDYLNTLLRDTTSSHLLEAIISRCPGATFDVLWNLYFEGRLPRLAVHPVANFVVAKALERVNENQLLGACQELGGSWSKLISSSRTGVLRAAIERTSHLEVLGGEAINAVFSAFNLDTAEARLCMVPCVLALVPFEEYTARKSTSAVGQSERLHGKEKPRRDALEPQVQGSLLLQALLRLPEPHHHAVVDSINSLPIEERIGLAHHSVSSRVYDALFSSPTIPHKTKRILVMSFIGYYHQLVNDRFGSRVVDRCWDFSDTYLKEKIARSLFPQQHFLAGSFYGKYFSRNLNLYLLQRKPEEWRNFQTDKKKRSDNENNAQSSSTAPPNSQPLLPRRETQSDKKVEEAAVPPSQVKKKRKHQGDEIDALFETSLGKKVKKAALISDLGTITPKSNSGLVEKPASGVVDKNLEDVLGVIRTAPKGEKPRAKKKR